MELRNEKLDEQSSEFIKSPNTSGTFNKSLPDTIVIHYTAGSSAESSVDTLTNPDVNASAHLVVGG